MIYAPNVLHFSKPTCGEVTLEDEGDGEVEEHVGDPGDPACPEQLPVKQLDLRSTLHDLVRRGRKPVELEVVVSVPGEEQTLFIKIF